jgi:ubiquinol-cytochrome c reductase iron-sulfur subunit
VSRPERPPEPPTSRTGLINASFLVSAAASIGLAVLYARGGQPQIEGALILVALGGIAAGLIAWAHRFLPQGPYVQAREPLPSTPLERRAFAEDFERGAEAIGRRTFMVRLLGLALGAFGVAAIFPIRSLGPSPRRSLFVTEWRRGSRVVTANNEPVAVGDLNVGSIVTVFPEGHPGSADSQTVLIRIDPQRFRPLPGREGWVPDGYVAYSKVCTHAGCPVGLYEQQTGRLFCPCHQSVFDALDGARPVQGPATRPLPQLPLEVDGQGFLRAQHDFDEPVGPGFWNEGHGP